VLRASLSPEIAHVIPNALLADQFRPAAVPPPLNPSTASLSTFTRGDSLCSQSSSWSSLVWHIARASISLWLRRRRSAPSFPTSGSLSVLITLAACTQDAGANERAGGDGPKLIDILQMREKHLLQDRIELLGPVRPADVRDVSCELST
jgi:phosphatidylinositol glycan class A protein